MTIFIITFSLTSKEKYELRQSCQLKIAQHAFGKQKQEIAKVDSYIMNFALFVDHNFI